MESHKQKQKQELTDEERLKKYIIKLNMENSQKIIEDFYYNKKTNYSGKKNYKVFLSTEKKTIYFN
jgi:hypothetical protein